MKTLKKSFGIGGAFFCDFQMSGLENTVLIIKPEKCTDKRVKHRKKIAGTGIFAGFLRVTITSLLVRLLSRIKSSDLLPSGNEKRAAIIGVFFRSGLSDTLRRSVLNSAI